MSACELQTRRQGGAVNEIWAGKKAKAAWRLLSLQEDKTMQVLVKEEAAGSVSAGFCPLEGGAETP